MKAPTKYDNLSEYIEDVTQAIFLYQKEGVETKVAELLELLNEAVELSKELE